MSSAQEPPRLRLQQVVFRYIDVVNHYFERLYPNLRPEPNSQAAQDVNNYDSALADEWSAEPVALALGAAQTHMASAQDHLFGVGLILASNAESSLVTVSRGATEAAARASWLLGAGDCRQRIARCMTERLAGLRQEALTNARLKRELDTADRVRAIEESAIRHDFQVQSRRGRKFVGTEPYPGATRAIEQLFQHLGEDWGFSAYTDMSAVAHSATAAFIQRRSRLIIDPPHAGSEGETQGPIEMFVVVALSAFDYAFRSYLALYGWNPHPWDIFVRGALEAIREIFGVPLSAVDIARVQNWWSRDWRTEASLF